VRSPWGVLGYRVTSGDAREAEPEQADQVALDLVRAAAEGQDQETAVEDLELAVEYRLGRAALQVSALAEDLHEQAEALEIPLGAEHLRRTTRRRATRCPRRGPRHLPVDQAQELEPGVDAREVDLHPFLVDHLAAIGQLRALRPCARLFERTLEHHPTSTASRARG
jgi:hypothetical protein